MIRDLTGKAKSCPMCGSKRIYMDEPNFDKLFSVTIYCADCGLMGYKNFLEVQRILSNGLSSIGIQEPR